MQHAVSLSYSVPTAVALNQPEAGAAGQPLQAGDLRGAEALQQAVLKAASPLLRRALPPRASAAAAAIVTAPCSGAAQSPAVPWPPVQSPAAAPVRPPSSNEAEQTVTAPGLIELHSSDLADRVSGGSLHRQLGQATVVSQGAGETDMAWPVTGSGRGNILNRLHMVKLPA